MTWIYLECGHGKGIPDGLGAVCKRAIKEIINMNPEDCIYNVEDLLRKGLQEMVSMKILTFTTTDIEAKRKIFPLNLKTVVGTSDFHEVTALIQPNGLCQMYASNLSGEQRKKITV